MVEYKCAIFITRNGQVVPRDDSDVNPVVVTTSSTSLFLMMGFRSIRQSTILNATLREKTRESEGLTFRLPLTQDFFEIEGKM